LDRRNCVRPSRSPEEGLCEVAPRLTGGVTARIGRAAGTVAVNNDPSRAAPRANGRVGYLNVT